LSVSRPDWSAATSFFARICRELVCMALVMLVLAIIISLSLGY